MFFLAYNHRKQITINRIAKSQGSTLAVARSPNASENGGGRVKTLPSVARRASQNIVTDGPRPIYYMWLSW